MKELERYNIIKTLIKGQIDAPEASNQLNLSIRQTQRIKKKVKENGINGVIHANKGKPSNRKFKQDFVDKIVTIIKKNYPDFGPTLALEKLTEIHKTSIGLETLRLLMINKNLWKPKKRKNSKIKHLWRPRKDNYGQMQQFDGSYHHWFEDRGEESCLLLSIDDATSKITYAKFDYNEGVEAVFKFWLEYFKINNMPISIYLDKFSTYKINHKNAVDNKELMTQFQRATSKVGINLITAHTPEAKGRVERVFKTLQDRLVKEMRLNNISSIKEANNFLKIFIPKFNEKFSVVPNKKTDLHKKINKKIKALLPSIFSIQNKRKIQNDFTIMFKNKYLQLEKIQPTTVYKKDSVIVEEWLNGEIKVKIKDVYLNFFLLPKRPKKIINVKLSALTRTNQLPNKPPLNHPWRKFVINKKSKIFTN